MPISWGRCRGGLAVLLILLAAAVGASRVQAQDIRYFRIGTGPTGESHFSIGGLIASALSNPPGSRQCDRGGSCGVPGLIAVAQSTNGAVANVQAIGAHSLDAALVQADVAYWAFHGTGIYEGKGAISNLRAIAMLYSDNVHLVARKEANIKSVADLRGKRLSLGEPGSGSLVDGRILLQAYGLKEKDVKLVNLRPGPAADLLAAGQLDAMLVIDGVPVPAIADLAAQTAVELVPVADPQAESLTKAYPFFLKGEIPGGSYQGNPGPVPTLAVGVVLLVDAQADADLVYGITKALWHPNTLKILRQGHPRGAAIHLEAETGRMGIPLHAGAAAYYFDAGLVP